MLFKRITLYHLVPALIAVLITLGFTRSYHWPSPDLNFSAQKVKQTEYILHFEPYKLADQVAFSIALKQMIPVLMGSSELTSGHLEGLAQNFFTRNKTKDRFLSIGHAGFQSLGILTTLAANRELLKSSKITIILSPGWFEEEYSKGISLKTFFEYATPNYLYQILNDREISNETKVHIQKYISYNFDKISKPDATLRIMGKKQISSLNTLVNAPFDFVNNSENETLKEKDLYLRSQALILETLRKKNIRPHRFYDRTVNWDSLNTVSKKTFKSISNNNSISVENGYYDTWLKNKRKKHVVGVDKKENQEFKDLEILIRFLKNSDCQPLFVIMPLNSKAHDDLGVLKPIIRDINFLLKENEFKVLDMFSPNVENYQDGILEDIMHPYNLGWYQIDKFILDNYHDKN